jgi:hypothetical protein
MIVCPNCRSEQMIGTLFCSECGVDLQAPSVSTFDLANEPEPPEKKTTGPRPIKSIGGPAKSGAPPARPASNPAYAASAPYAIPEQQPVVRHSQTPTRSNFRLIILNSGRVLECADQENIIIGRADASTSDAPDIDLTPDNGVELGVSRRHACLTFRNNQIFLTDLGSTNRTFLNRQVLMRGQPYEIQDGDEIRLGNVIVKIIFDADRLPR